MAATRGRWPRRLESSRPQPQGEESHPVKLKEAHGTPTGHDPLLEPPRLPPVDTNTTADCRGCDGAHGGACCSNTPSCSSMNVLSFCSVANGQAKQGSRVDATMNTLA